MEPYAIDYSKISSSLNQFGNEVMKMIKMQYGPYISNVADIPSVDFIVVDEINREDIEFFSKQNGIENPEGFHIANVPSAHSGRTKNDGKIHIYPYSTNTFGNCKSTEEIIEICKRDLIVHEVFHYFIRPQINYPDGTIEAKFGHYLTEGLVQSYAESFAKNHNLPIPKSNYDQNVNMAIQLLNGIPTDTNLNYKVFNLSIDDLVNSSSVGEQLMERFRDKEIFNNKLNDFIIRSATKAGFNHEQIQSIQRYYSKMDNKSEIIKELSDNIQIAFNDNEMVAQEYISELNSLTNNESDNLKEKDQVKEVDGPKLVRTIPEQSSNKTTSNGDGKINLTLIIIAAIALLLLGIIGIFILNK